MGTHDKMEALVDDAMEFYKARIKHLEDEVARLKEEVKETERNLAVMTNLYEASAESIQRNEARSDAIIEQKNDEIAMAKEAIYLAAMREVALR